LIVSTAARLILGSPFNAPDLFWYAVGAVVGRLAVCLVPRRRGARARFPREDPPGL